MKFIDNITKWDGEDLLCACFGIALMALVSFGLYCLFHVILSDSSYVDRCYFEESPDRVRRSYLVKGHVPWNNDKVLAAADSPEQAVELMQKVCPIH